MTTKIRKLNPVIFMIRTSFHHLNKIQLANYIANNEDLRYILKQIIVYGKITKTMAHTYQQFIDNIDQELVHMRQAMKSKNYKQNKLFI